MEQEIASAGALSVLSSVSQKVLLHCLIFNTPQSPVLMCQWFAPSRLVITFEHDGPGAFSIDEIRDMTSQGGDGRVLDLLPKKSVLIANHQVRTLPNQIPSRDIALTTSRSTQTGGMRGVWRTL
jgi:hypothetical protein